MKGMIDRTGRIHWIVRPAAVIAAAAALAATLPADAQGRRGGGGPGPGDSSRSTPPPRNDPPPRSEPPARSEPRREESRPRHEEAPRREAPPREEYRPRQEETRRPEPPPARTETPRREETRREEPRREEVRPRQEEPRREEPRRDYSPRRTESPSRAEDAPRREETPRRETGSDAPRTERRPATTDTPDRGGDSRPTRTESGATRGESRPQRGEGTDRATERGTERGGDNGGAGNIFSRRPGGRDDSSARPGAGTNDPAGSQGRAPRFDRNGEPLPSSGPTRGGGFSVDRAAPQRNGSHDVFTRSREGRTYRHGVVLRDGGYVNDRYLRNYFPHSYAYYPHYYPRYEIGVTYYSPYSYYYGVCAPYIYRRHTHYYPPAAIYIEVPIYSGNSYYGWDRDDTYYLDRRDYRTDVRDFNESGLDRAVTDLREVFRYTDINLLAELTDPNIRIAVFRKGKYEYSLEANDYLDMTRDMLRTVETVQFDLYRFRRRASGVYVASGQHVYYDRDNRKRTVYVSFVFERLGGRWAITQVGTSPDKIEDPR